MENKEVKARYNKNISQNQRYEQKRWFKNKIQRAGYEMTKDAVWRRALASSYNSCLELGPGHGTWTKELFKFSSLAEYELVDISGEMLGLVKERFRDRENIGYVESDLLDFNPGKEYDFFFSSRVIEYIRDKEKAVEKILILIKPYGRGVIITKTPKYMRNKLIGRKTAKFHQGQILPKKLADMIIKNGGDKVEVFPVVMSFPGLRIVAINKFLYKMFNNHRLNCISRFFAESYLIRFIKKP